MSHIDAKAETKGMEGTWPAICVQRAFVEGMRWWQFNKYRSTIFNSERDEAEAEAISRYGEPNPQPQRHARINCNGKSCGEFNCDTCHPQEGELSEELHDLLERVEVRTPTEIVVRKTQSELEKCKAAFTALRLADQATIAETLAAAIEQSQRAKKADVELKAMTEDRNLWRDAHNDDCPNIIRAEAAEAELAALKATPKERPSFEKWSEDYQVGYGQFLGFEEEVALSAWNAAQSSPSLPLEEPATPAAFLSDEVVACYADTSTATHVSLLATEVQGHRRALAARRGGR